jgi:hypothetical protein
MGKQEPGKFESGSQESMNFFFSRILLGAFSTFLVSQLDSISQGELFPSGNF